MLDALCSDLRQLWRPLPSVFSFNATSAQNIYWRLNWEIPQLSCTPHDQLKSQHFDNPLSTFHAIPSKGAEQLKPNISCSSFLANGLQFCLQIPSKIWSFGPPDLQDRLKSTKRILVRLPPTGNNLPPTHISPKSKTDPLLLPLFAGTACPNIKLAQLSSLPCPSPLIPIHHLLDCFMYHISIQ